MFVSGVPFENCHLRVNREILLNGRSTCSSEGGFRSRNSRSFTLCTCNVPVQFCVSHLVRHGLAVWRVRKLFWRKSPAWRGSLTNKPRITGSWFERDGNAKSIHTNGNCYRINWLVLQILLLLLLVSKRKSCVKTTVLDLPTHSQTTRCSRPNTRMRNGPHTGLNTRPKKHPTMDPMYIFSITNEEEDDPDWRWFSTCSSSSTSSSWKPKRNRRSSSSSCCIR